MLGHWLLARLGKQVLRPGGLGLSRQLVARLAVQRSDDVPDGLDQQTKDEIQGTLSETIHVGARPLTPIKWRNLLASEGFEVQAKALTPMRLLEVERLIRDEGLAGTLRFGWNVLRDRTARRRVAEMRHVFRRYRAHLGAIMLVGGKPVENGHV